MKLMFDKLLSIIAIYRGDGIANVLRIKENGRVAKNCSWLFYIFTFCSIILLESIILFAYFEPPLYTFKCAMNINLFCVCQELHLTLDINHDIFTH